MLLTSELSAALVLAATASATKANAHNYSYNWAGGLIEEPGKVVEVCGQIVVPECSGPYLNSISGIGGWVGIDGGTNCDTVVLQTGFSCQVVNSDGAQNITYAAWTEWYPAQSVPYDNFNVQSGDLLSLKVTAKSKTAGSTSVYNHRTGQKKETHYDNQPSLCLDYAEWIVESEFVEEHGIVGGELTANFTPIHFEQSSYRTSDHKKVLVGADDLLNMVQNGNTTIAVATFHSPGDFFVDFVQPASWHPWQ